MAAAFDTHKTVNALVRENHRLADVFRRYGIGYCCGGNLPLADVCDRQGIDTDGLLAEMKRATATMPVPSAAVAAQWPVPFAIDYLIHVHHAWLRQGFQSVTALLQKLVASHGTKNPALHRLQAAFLELVQAEEARMEAKKEILFPYLRHVAAAEDPFDDSPLQPFRKPLLDLISGNTRQLHLHRLRQLTHNYHAHNIGCTTQHIAYNGLRELDEALQAIHLLEQETVAAALGRPSSARQALDAA